MLLRELALLLALWRSAFTRSKAFTRVASVLIGLACARDGKTVSKSVRYRGNELRWSSDYRVFSRSNWSVATLFDAVLEVGMKLYESLVSSGTPIVLYVDDTSSSHRGRSRLATWMKDPLSPPFHVNLKRGFRFVHFVLNLPFHVQGYDARAVSLSFELAPALKKPGTKATPEEIARYRQQKKTTGLAHSAVAALRRIRDSLAALGYGGRRLLLVGDGSFTNRTIFRSLIDGVDYLGRTRKNLALWRPATDRRRVYGERLPTPEELRKDEAIPYQVTEAHYGGARRQVRYKEIRDVLWQRGAGRRPLRLLIIAPMPYTGCAGRRKYRDPAYLLTTDLSSPVAFLIQAYLDRWQIEVIHREVKSTMGVGKAQVWSEKSVTRLHSAYVAFSSMLLLASLRRFGPGRSDAFPPLPPWRRVSKIQRPSFSDLSEMLRHDIAIHGLAEAQDEATSSAAA